MRKLFASFLFMLPLLAQTEDAPARVFRIIREDIKQGRRAAHERQEGAAVRAVSRARFPVHYVALSSVAGEDEVWFIQNHTSFAQMEESDEALDKSAVLKNELEGLDAADGEFRTGRQVWLAVHRSDLSYRTDALAKMMPRSRYMSVGIVRVRPGHDREFSDLARALADNYGKANDDRPYTIYQVISGAQTGTYVIFAPMLSLRLFDEAADRTRALRNAIGEDRLRELSRSSSEHIVSTDSALFEISPAMSYAPPEYSRVNPDLWGPAPPPPAKQFVPARR